MLLTLFLVSRTTLQCSAVTSEGLECGTFLHGNFQMRSDVTFPCEELFEISMQEMV